MTSEGGGGMVVDLREGESLQIISLGTLDGRKLTVTLNRKDGRRARLVVKAEPSEFQIDRLRLLKPQP
jgi:hypothetical protein